MDPPSAAIMTFEIYMKQFIFVLRYEMKVKCDHRSKFSNLSNWKVEALIFFGLLLSNCLNWKIYCDDHTSLSIMTLPSKECSLLRNRSREKNA